jgi:hypothetical protein
LFEVREAGCSAQAASSAARKLMGVLTELALPGWILDTVLDCASAIGGKARKALATTEATTLLRRSEFEN